MKALVRLFSGPIIKKFSKRADKKNVNLPWNSGLFFQLGLIISLFVVFIVMESTHGVTPTPIAIKERPLMMDPPVFHFDIEQPVEVKVKDPNPPQVLKPLPPSRPAHTFTPVPNSAPTVASPPIAPEGTPVPPVRETPTANPPVPSGPKNIFSVEFVPVFPGCENQISNEDRKQCMSDKIRAFIAREFKADRINGLNSGTTYRIGVQFKIDSNGNVTDIQTRAKEEALEKETQRVIGKLPVMEPGKQGNMPVDVIFALPIVFHAQ